MSDIIVALVAGLGGSQWAFFLVLILLFGSISTNLYFFKDARDLRQALKDALEQLAEVNKDFSDNNNRQSETNIRVMDGLGRLIDTVKDALK